MTVFYLSMSLDLGFQMVAELLQPKLYRLFNRFTIAYSKKRAPHRWIQVRMIKF